MICGQCVLRAVASTKRGESRRARNDNEGDATYVEGKHQGCLMRKGGTTETNISNPYACRLHKQLAEFLFVCRLALATVVGGKAR